MRWRTDGTGPWTTQLVNGLTFTIPGLTNAQVYEVQVRATNGQGNSNYSPSARTSPVQPAGEPDAPNPPMLEVAARQIKATWVAPADNGSLISSYVVRWALTGTNNWTEQNVGSTLTYTISSLTAAETYDVQVAAINAVGQGPWSGTAMAQVPGPPARPAPPMLTAGQRSAMATWVAPADNGSMITGFRLRYRISGAWTTLDYTPGTTSANITGLTAGQTYQFQVQATNVLGDSLWSVSATVIPLAQIAAPDRPAAPSLAAGNATLTATWAAPNNNGSPITAYRLRHRTGGGIWTEVAVGDVLTYLIINLMNGVDYEVQVLATNGIGDSPWSFSAQASPNATATRPDTPVSPPSLIAGDARIEAVWSPPHDGGSPITSYTLRYRIGAGAWTNITETTTSRVVTGLTNGTTYQFQYRANNSVGNGLYSPSAFGIPTPQAPDTLISFGAFNFSNNAFTAMSLDGLRQASIDDNFAEVIPIMTRLPNSDGAFDEYGTGVAPQAPGMVRASFWIVARHATFMRSMRSAFARMAGYGLTTLLRRALDGTAVECEARVKRIDWPRDVGQAPHRQLRVSLEFDVPSPGWRSSTTTQVDRNNIDDGDTLTVNVDGEAWIRPRIRVERASAPNINQVIIERQVSGVAVDRITYDGTLDSNDTLWVDCERRTVEENGADAFGDFDADSGAWLELDPNGTNSLVVELSPSNATADIRIEYEARYYN